MLKLTQTILRATLVMSACLGSSAVQAAGNQGPVGILGTDGWLFTAYDISTAADIPDTTLVLDIIRRVNKVFATNGIAMGMVIIPMKMRIYSEFLPPSSKMNREMVIQYDRILKAFRAGHVEAVDLNTPFMAKANREGPFPLFLKLDTHWSPSGALLGAETIKAEIQKNPVLKKAYDATPVEKYKLEISKAKKRNNSQDLPPQLPVEQQKQFSFRPDETLLYKGSREKGELPAKGGPAAGVALVGSSSSKPFTGFPEALRYALQRDIIISNFDGVHGAWWGMEGYLRSAEFQTTPPKLLLWEIGERELRSPPNFQYRDPRFNSDNTEWLLRISALVQTGCKASTVTGKLGSAGLAANASNQKGGDVVSGPTSETDFLELNFSEPLGKLDYISAKLPASASKTVTIEASGADVATRKFVAEVAGNGALKYPLTSAGKGYTKARIFPGKTDGFKFQGLQICRQPDDVLT